MKDKLAAFLDKSLRRNGVSLTRSELNEVAKDLGEFFDSFVPPAVEEPKAPVVQPPPPPGGAGN